MRSQILWAAIAVLASLAIIPTTEAGFEDVQGNFCRNRKPSECCEDRLDGCEVPIKGTYCYCDEFCLEGDRTDNDCCPDFLEVCMGKTKPAELQRDEPPKGIATTIAPTISPKDCDIGGLKVANGDSVMENCNECRCQNGRLECDEDCCMVDEEIISTINESPTIFGWHATNYPDHWSRKTRDGLKLKTGTFNPQDQSGQMYPVKLNPDVSKIPVTFDARRKTNWAGRVGEVCDQGWCGASWAFSTLGVAQDRVSILARGHGRMELSAQNLLSCAQLGQKGCEGGYIDRAWNYIRSRGIVRESCYQYESGKSGMVPKCLLRRNDLSRLTCELKDRFKMEPAYRISSKEEDIQWEIMTNGPVQAFMTVHSDLFMYKSGVYSYTSLTAMKEPEVDSATHSVRIIGWGMTRMLSSHATKYWLVANSWGTQWGERGYFRIKRGTNECGIESFILAARAKLANFSYGSGSQVPLLPLPE